MCKGIGGMPIRFSYRGGKKVRESGGLHLCDPLLHLWSFRKAFFQCLHVYLWGICFFSFDEWVSLAIETFEYRWMDGWVYVSRW